MCQPLIRGSAIKIRMESTGPGSRIQAREWSWPSRWDGGEGAEGASTFTPTRAGLCWCRRVGGEFSSFSWFHC